MVCASQAGTWHYYELELNWWPKLPDADYSAQYQTGPLYSCQNEDILTVFSGPFIVKPPTGNNK